MGSAGRSGSAATTRATSAQTDGAILADADGDGDVSEPHPTRRGRNAPGLQKRPDY